MIPIRRAGPVPLLVAGPAVGASPTVGAGRGTLAGMTATAPSQEESPTCRVRHFSTDPDDDGQLVAGAKIRTISRVALAGYQARGFAEVDDDGQILGEIPKADEPKADEPKAAADAKTKPAPTGGSN